MSGQNMPYYSSTISCWYCTCPPGDGADVLGAGGECAGDQGDSEEGSL